MIERIKHLMAGAFSTMFLIVAASLALLSMSEFFSALTDASGKEVISGIVRAMNTVFIALATFELGVGIGREYTLPDQGPDLFPVVRRTITRFVSVVCIAMVLEALIMIIKYSQLEQAGNLYYPVAVSAAASVLLMSLGVFIHLTRRDVVGQSGVMRGDEGEAVEGSEPSLAIDRSAAAVV
jgi:hypothetical protein